MARDPVVVCTLLFLSVVLIAAPVVQGISCGTVASSLAQCVKYITNKGPLLPGCCAGVKSLNAAANSPAARQSICACLKNFSGSIPGVNYGLVGGLPGKCGVSTPYPINPSTDCSKIH